jgi:hypothetical protein
MYSNLDVQFRSGEGLHRKDSVAAARNVIGFETETLPSLN